MKTIIVDAMEKQCPVPVILTKKQLDNLTDTSLITVLADNKTAVENLRRLAESTGAKPEIINISDSKYKVSFVAEPAKGSTAQDKPLEKDGGSSPDKKADGSTVCVFSSGSMGTGSDELGAVLIKGFIYAISHMDELPDCCLFYNGGAFLTAEGSDSLEDIKLMEDAGVEIITCGTCADFYGIKDKIKVGRIGNMYDIAEKMTQASNLIRP